MDENENELRSGLGDGPVDAWPTYPGGDPIDVLEDKEIHDRVLRYLVDRIEFSERKMCQFYPRWRVNEKKVQAYINLSKMDKVLENMNKSGRPPQIVNIVMPYEFATVWTIVTYLMQVFCGRRPLFTVSANSSEFVDNAAAMEQYLQYNAEHIKLVNTLYSFIQNSQVYGLGVMRSNWVVEKRYRTMRSSQEQQDFFGNITGQTQTKSRELVTVFEGNEVVDQDPFMFFPDPRVPMTEVNRKGEWVAWRDFIGLHILKQMEADGDIKYLSKVGSKVPVNNESNTGDMSDSVRALRAQGDSTPGQEPGDRNVQNFIQIDQGSFDIIPAELGLGEEKTPQKFIFTIGNKRQIIQAAKLEFDHGMHPVCVTEPLMLGKGFGNLGMADMLGPIQDSITWLLNSHMDNVRRTLNNQFIVDPSMVEMQDLRKPGPGKHIRLKRTAYGLDVRQAIYQLSVTDVTRSHVGDLDVIMRMGEKMSSVTENMMGLQDRGGRKSATEVRRAGDAGGSRLAMMATLISSQAICDLAEQMSINTQQYLSDDFQKTVLGKDSLATPINLSAQTLTGDFNFPVHDGTLPVDKVAMLDVWKEILIAVMQDQELRQTFSVPKMFEWVAKLGGAQNISSFKIEMSPMQTILKQLQAGNMVPANEAGGLTGGSPPSSGLGQRMLAGQA